MMRTRHFVSSSFVLSYVLLKKKMKRNNNSWYKTLQIWFKIFFFFFWISCEIPNIIFHWPFLVPFQVPG